MDDAHATSLTANTHTPVERRQFLFMTSCAAGFAAAAGPVNAQVITTSAEGLTAGEVKVPSLGVDIPAYRAFPAQGGPFPTVVVIQEIFGVHEHIKDVVRRLAKAGYYAIAPELYARQGDPSKIDDVGKLISDIVSKVPDAQVSSDVDNTIAFAKASGKGDTAKLGIIGFCWGGRQVWLQCARNPAIKAAAVFYGPLGGKPDELHPKTVLDVIKDVKTPVIGAYGGADPGIPQDQVEAARAALKAAGAPSEINVYPDAPHGFNADYRPSYRKEAAQEAWSKALAWFKKNGVG
jgi:carboxymethylenebutenolidase